MKKIILAMIVFVVSSFADSALILQKGWQLIGSTSKITDMQIFNSSNVEQIWHFNASEQRWKGYSPDSTIAKKMRDKGYESIDTLESRHGFWIKSKKEWALTFPADTSSSDENITLKKGWNLISLPVNTVVSPHIFDGHTLWKYANNNQWEFYDNDTQENFPIISHISNSNGIWVKSDKDQIISTVTNSAKLHHFNDVDTMKAYIKDMVLTNNRPYFGYYPLIDGINYANGAPEGVAAEAPQKNSAPVSGAANSAPSADNTSGTNLQEAGVDESDIIKHDDTNIFYVSRDTTRYNAMFINVTTFQNIVNHDLKPVQTITIDGYIDSLYLVGKRLVVLSAYASDNVKPAQPTPVEKIALDHGGEVSSMIVDIYDVSDISHIQKITSFKINGNLNDSRVVAGKLYLVTNFRPFIQYEYPKIFVDAPECKEYFFGNGDHSTIAAPVSSVDSPNDNQQVPSYDDTYKKYARCFELNVYSDNRFYRYDYDNPKIVYENIIPYMQKDNDPKVMLIKPETFFAPDKKDQQPVITTVSKIDIESASFEKTTSVLGYSNTLYASQNALYMVSDKYPLFYNFDRYQERSVIYKIALDDALSYQASGFVKGRVLNQFGLSEYQNILRIATTQGNSWQNNTTNALFTLKQQDDLLLIYGTLSGLGKQGEIIRSVRFAGDHGFVVTFKQTDPFYTIDLSAPAAPKKAGELKIYGYSAYLHPIDENHILGIGRDATPQGQVLGLKMELFDISDLTHPTSIDSYSFGSLYSYGEIENNHKALAYRDSDKLLGFAYRAGDTYWEDGKNYFGVYQIDNNKISVFNPIVSPNNERYYGGYERGLIFDFAGQTYIAYFANGQIAYSSLDNLRKE